MNADITHSNNGGEIREPITPVAKSPTLRKSLKASLNKNKIISFEDCKN